MFHIGFAKKPKSGLALVKQWRVGMIENEKLMSQASILEFDGSGSFTRWVSWSNSLQQFQQTWWTLIRVWGNSNNFRYSNSHQLPTSERLSSRFKPHKYALNQIRYIANNFDMNWSSNKGNVKALQTSNQRHLLFSIAVCSWKDASSYNGLHELVNQSVALGFSR